MSPEAAQRFFFYSILVATAGLAVLEIELSSSPEEEPPDPRPSRAQALHLEGANHAHPE